MHLHADLSQRVVVDFRAQDWRVATPGVVRCLLERDGERTTALVRYAAGARVAEHTHALGRELYVVEGQFADEHAVYPAGMYLRLPRGASHAPFSTDGCLLFVKSLAPGAGDTGRAVVDTRTGGWKGPADGVQRMLLHGDPAGERVLLSRYAPGARLDGDLHTGGEEVLVLEGELCDEYGIYPAGTWLRQPHGSRHSPYSPEGCLLWVKRGHLPR